MAEDHAVAHAGGSAHVAHKSPNYVLIFVWLIVITAAEVGVGYIPADIVPNVVTFPVLLIMAATKALLVVLYYMHLRYDSKWFVALMLVAMPLSALFILAMVLGFVRQ
ncbi:MAG TPA: cytochrome C oxidase subunit IV family protein [Anaerolineales bacterium]|nr:cytochrome C oxidase subunit IV family protein [Anaerolineales bacterium]